MPYFDYASLGIPNQDDLKELSTLLKTMPNQIVNFNGDYTLQMVEILEETRANIANTYNVSSKNIALIPNTTSGLGLVASSLMKVLDVKVLIPDIEFMSSALVWKEDSDLEKITFCNTIDGTININKMNHYMNQHNVLCMSSVQEVSGYRFSFEDLLKVRDKKHDEFWIVDGIQEAGVFKRDLKKDQIDAYIVGGHKWLNSPFGLGFMYLSDRLLENLQPDYYGYFNIKEPDIGWVNYLESRSRKLEDLMGWPNLQNAQVFESGGMVNMVGAYMLNKSFERWKQAGFEEIEAYILDLQDYFRKKILNQTDFRILGGHSIKNWSSITTLTNPDNPNYEKDLLIRLNKLGYKASLRSIEGIGGVRLGFHFTTTKKEIDLLLEQIID